MASFDDDADAAGGSGDEFENEDEEMEDAGETNQYDDQDQGQDDDGGDEDEDDENDDGDNDDDDGDDDDANEGDSPAQRASQYVSARRSPAKDESANPAVVLTSPSPHTSAVRSPGAGIVASYIPPTRPEALVAQAYDIVPTMAAPQGTSINAVAATPDMRWVFSGGSDGYVRMFNWVETANGKVPLTVAQKHPFVDSVMKAGSLLTYWENEEAPSERTPLKGEEGDGKWLSPVYSLAVNHQAIWLLSGLESGGINLQTCRHQAGTRITTLKEHTSAVSVLVLSQDETSLLSGSWDKTVLDWDLQTGKVKRSFLGGGGQISAVETRPMSNVPVPEISEPVYEPLNGTYSSNNADRPFLNGTLSGSLDQQDFKGGEEDALGSPSGSLFGEGDHGDLFGEGTGTGGGGNAFGDDDDDELTRALANEMQEADPDPPIAEDMEMTGMGSGGPVQPPDPVNTASAASAAGVADESQDSQPKTQTETNSEQEQEQRRLAGDTTTTTGAIVVANGLPHFDEPLTAPPTNEDSKHPQSDLPPQSESTFLDAAFDGTLRIWDRRMSTAIATIPPHSTTPPWCTGACWSPDGNFFYAGRRNCTVDEFSIHKLGSNRSKPERVFRFQQGSGSVYAVRSMPNGRNLVCASQDILRIYDLATTEDATRHRSGPPFNIVPGHRGGVISAIYIDPSCRFMLSAAGNRGWESTAGTEVLLGYEIGVQDKEGVWHK